MVLPIKSDSLALRTESREEWIFSSGINYMSDIFIVEVHESVEKSVVSVCKRTKNS